MHICVCYAQADVPRPSSVHTWMCNVEARFTQGHSHLMGSRMCARYTSDNLYVSSNNTIESQMIHICIYHIEKPIVNTFPQSVPTCLSEHSI